MDDDKKPISEQLNAVKEGKLTVSERLSGRSTRIVKDPLETPLNEATAGAKERYRSNSSGWMSSYNAPLSELEERTVRDMVQVELGYIIRDAIAPYKISDPYLSGSAVIPYYLRPYYDGSVNLGDIVMDYMLHDKSTYSRVVVADGISVVMPITPDDEMSVGTRGTVAMTATLSLSGSPTSYPVSHAIIVQGTGGNATKRTLLTLFRLLASVYESLKNVSDINRKLFFHLDGLSAILEKTSAVPDAQAMIMQDLVSQLNSVLRDEVVILDKTVELKVAPVSFDGVSAIIDFIYKEMARLLKVPQTKLIGTAPSGLNATGEYDDKNYQDTLQAVRKNVVEPTLAALGYEYTIEYAIDASDFKARMEAINMLAQDVTITLEGKHTLVQKLMPWLSDDEIDMGANQDELASRIADRMNMLGYSDEDMI